MQNYSVLPLIAKCWLKRILEKWNWKNGIFNFCLYKNQIFGKSDFGKIWLSNTVESQSWVVLGPVNIWLLPQLLIGTQEIHIFGNSEFRKIRFLENQIFEKSDFPTLWKVSHDLSLGLSTAIDRNTGNSYFWKIGI